MLCYSIYNFRRGSHLNYYFWESLSLWWLGAKCYVVFRIVFLIWLKSPAISIHQLAVSVHYNVHVQYLHFSWKMLHLHFWWSLHPFIPYGTMYRKFINSIEKRSINIIQTVFQYFTMMPFGVMWNFLVERLFVWCLLIF